jgi:hypothetical protein
LTNDAIYSFKEEKKYKNPTETIFLKEITTIRSTEEEIFKENSFVKNN